MLRWLSRHLSPYRADGSVERSRPPQFGSHANDTATETAPPPPWTLPEVNECSVRPFLVPLTTLLCIVALCPCTHRRLWRLGRRAAHFVTRGRVAQKQRRDGPLVPRPGAYQPVVKAEAESALSEIIE